MARRLTTLRMSRPAPAASRTASAICPTTSALSSAPPRVPTPPVRVVASTRLEIAAAPQHRARHGGDEHGRGERRRHGQPRTHASRAGRCPPALRAATPAAGPGTRQRRTSRRLRRRRRRAATIRRAVVESAAGASRPARARTPISLALASTWPSINAATFAHAMSRITAIAVSVASKRGLHVADEELPRGRRSKDCASCPMLDSGTRS